MWRQLGVILAVAVFSTKAAEVRGQHRSILSVQKDALELLSYFDQPNEFYSSRCESNDLSAVNVDEESLEFKIYWDEFLERIKNDRLPRGALFSIFYDAHLTEAKLLFRLFYTAKDLWSLVEIASQTRCVVNQELFDYAFRMAYHHREDTKDFAMPRNHYARPLSFFSPAIIEQARNYKNNRASAASKNDPLIIDVEVEHWEEDTQQAMSTLLNDVHLNDFYSHLHVDYPFWMPVKDQRRKFQRRGEFVYFMEKMLLSRYYLEHMSNNLGEIEFLDLNYDIETGFDPHLTHYDGSIFPSRPPKSRIPSHLRGDVAILRNYEARLLASIDTGVLIDDAGKYHDIYSQDGFEMLCNLVQGNAESLNGRVYGNIPASYRHILGFTPSPKHKYDVRPNAMEYYTTSLRDPGFYAMAKRIGSYYLRYKNNLPHYTKTELSFEGVRIQSLEIDRLRTYFQDFETQISSVVPFANSKEAETVAILAKWTGLNHVPFTYNITLDSTKEVQAVFRVFLGPDNYTGAQIDETWMHFYQLDYFVADLKIGRNVISRNSIESVMINTDYGLHADLLSLVRKAIDEKQSFNEKKSENKFPAHLLLPKGSEKGTPFQLFVHVSEHKIISGRNERDNPMYDAWPILDDKPLGFPLDRPMQLFNWTQPNMITKTVQIWHTGTE